jgi:hypothetical protein
LKNIDVQANTQYILGAPPPNCPGGVGLFVASPQPHTHPLSFAIYTPYAALRAFHCNPLRSHATGFIGYQTASVKMLKMIWQGGLKTGF